MWGTVVDVLYMLKQPGTLLLRVLRTKALESEWHPGFVVEKQDMLT